ncbi:MAG: hypothetical protein JXA78_16690 [Anaerolineales bacterium]|nr:hypothetical protein [Anaerolineales bacterium]
MEHTVKLTVRLPTQLHELLKQRSRARSDSLNKVIVETLWQSLSEQSYDQDSERQRSLKVIRESGIWEPLGPEWQAEIAKALKISHAELRQEMKDVPPFSETIIEDRGLR